MNGGVISWRSFLENNVALSTPEAEYMALSDAGKEARALLKLAKNLIDPNISCIEIYEDNRAAEIWTREINKHASKTKQIDICYHHIRDEVKKNRIKVLPVPSNDNLADALTKPLSNQKFQILFGQIFGN